MRTLSLQRRHNGRNGISNHWCVHCLLSCLFRRRSKKISKLRVTGLCEGNSQVTGKNSSHKGPETQKMFPKIDDVIMSAWWQHWQIASHPHLQATCLQTDILLEIVFLTILFYETWNLYIIFICPHWYVAGSWNPSSWTIHLSCIVNTMVAAGLATHGARASANMVLT